jgi:phosphonate transport system permease protein
VLGVVGAGGIGFELIAALRVLAYDQVAAVMLCILGAVTLVDGLGGVIRRRLR